MDALSLQCDRESVILSITHIMTEVQALRATELHFLRERIVWRELCLETGERTGNLDILTVAYNMFSQGINPELNIENVTEIKEVYERCCKMDVPMRHPYAGKLVFTAFSGSHQDAINKGMKAMQERRQEWWEVHLPIDPSDIEESTSRHPHQQPVR